LDALSSLIVEVAHSDPGPDRKASGPANRTHDVEPKAGAADFDDAGWASIAPEDLEERRTTGRLAFGWYRARITIPERVGGLDPTAATVALEIVADDYAEVWVDGHLPQVLGQRGGALAAGWNAPNRVLLTRDARAGDTHQIAILVANAPLSDPPANFVWLRSATLDFWRPGRFDALRAVPLEVTRLDPRLDGIVPRDARLEQLAEGFLFTEGPVWVPEGYLLFSDPNANNVYRWSPEGSVSVYRSKSGYKGLDMGQYRQPGSNGLALDREGRLTICEHGNRRVTRLEKNGTLTVLADRYQGRRLNSPNDLVYRSDGALYFTDPPFGLPRLHDDPRRELWFTGVYCLIGGELALVGADLRGPNGIAFSPDGRFLYVATWDVEKKIVKLPMVG
jgi:gluconolactonase